MTDTFDYAAYYDTAAERYHQHDLDRIPATIDACKLCGALVVDRDAHDTFHGRKTLHEIGLGA